VDGDRRSDRRGPRSHRGPRVATDVGRHGQLRIWSPKQVPGGGRPPELDTGDQSVCYKSCIADAPSRRVKFRFGETCAYFCLLLARQLLDKVNVLPVVVVERVRDVPDAVKEDAVARADRNPMTWSPSRVTAIDRELLAAEPRVSPHSRRGVEPRRLGPLAEGGCSPVAPCSGDTSRRAPRR
jgi:hypothetical protein